MNIDRKIINGLFEISNLLCALLFVYAAVSKVLEYADFEAQLGQSPLLSAYAGWLAWALPALEVAIATALVVKKMRLLGLYGFYVLMCMFTAYIIIILNFTSFVPCSCGGVLEEMGWGEHLVFNTAFIIVSALAIADKCRQHGIKPRKILLYLLSLALLAGISVGILFSSSTKQIARNNAFIRSYMPHALEKLGEYDLKYNSYYIAGTDSSTIYLGNYNAPLLVTMLDASLSRSTEARIKIDSMHLPFSRVRIAIKDGHFFVGDGSVPVLFSGRILDWKGKIFSLRQAYFKDFIFADSSRIGFISTAATTRRRTLGAFSRKSDTVSVFLAEGMLSEATDAGTFDTDGTMLWNEMHGKFLYTYFYRNQYLAIDRNLSGHAIGKTIDTISVPVLNVAHYSRAGHYQLGSGSVLVNRQTATNGNYLYVHSDRLGKYEDDGVLRSASIIDVYDLRSNTYAFSFHLYHEAGKKISEFRIQDDLLVAIVDSRLWLYRLKPKYFETGSDRK